MPGPAPNAGDSEVNMGTNSTTSWNQHFSRHLATGSAQIPTNQLPCSPEKGLRNPLLLLPFGEVREGVPREKLGHWGGGAPDSSCSPAGTENCSIAAILNTHHTHRGSCQRAAEGL